MQVKRGLVSGQISGTGGQVFFLVFFVILAGNWLLPTGITLEEFGSSVRDKVVPTNPLETCHPSSHVTCNWAGAHEIVDFQIKSKSIKGLFINAEIITPISTRQSFHQSGKRRRENSERKPEESSLHDSVFLKGDLH